MTLHQNFALVLETDPALLRATLSGTWESRSLARFRTELVEALDRLQRLQSPPRLLIDARSAAVQTQDIVSDLQRFASDFQFVRVAVVVATTLTKMQIQRIVPSPSHRVFQSQDDALQWLIARAAS